MLDRSQISDFLRALHIPEPALFQSWGPETSPRVKDGATRRCSAAEVPVRDRWGLGVTINEVNGNRRDLASMVAPRAVWVDIDTGSMPGHPLLERATVIARTPRGGHVYWSVDGPMQWGTWRALQLGAAQLLGGDPCTDRARAMRVPGSLHWKTGEPKLVELVQCNPGNRYATQALCSMFGVRDIGDDERVIDEPDPKRMPSLGQRVADYRRWLQRQAPAVEGEHGHQQALRVCMAAGDHALEWFDCDDLVREWNDRCSPPWTAHELRALFHSAQKSRRNPAGVAYMTRMLVPGEESRPSAREIVSPRVEPEPPPVYARIDPTDPLAVAEGFIASNWTRNGDRTLHYWRSRWWRWVDGRYRWYDLEALRRDLWQYLARCIMGTADAHARVKPNDGMVRSIEHAMRATCYLPLEDEAPFWLALPDDIDSEIAQRLDTDWTVVRNGALHLPTRTFVEATPRLFNLARTTVEYQPGGAGCPQWHSFLRDLWPKDEDARALLQEWFGYCLTSDIAHQKALFLVGPSRAGKGTIAYVLRELIGPDTVGAAGINDLEKQFLLGMLPNKSVAIIPDARLSNRSDQMQILERLLSIIGGDPVVVEAKRKDPYNAILQMKFMILSNPPIPELHDPSGAFAARMLPLALTRSFKGREDTQLRYRLVASELAGIFEWAIEGWERLQRRKRFTAASPELTKDLERNCNPIVTFVSEACSVEDPSAWESTGALYRAYSLWCASAGHHPGRPASFARALKAEFNALEPERKTLGDEHRIRGYRGIRIIWAELPNAQR